MLENSNNQNGANRGFSREINAMGFQTSNFKQYYYWKNYTNSKNKNVTARTEETHFTELENKFFSHL